MSKNVILNLGAFGGTAEEVLHGLLAGDFSLKAVCVSWSCEDQKAAVKEALAAVKAEGLDIPVPVCAGAKNSMSRYLLKKEKTECSGKACDDDREKPAALMLLELLKASEERVILLSTGPLTDLAHTLRIRPGLSKKIEKVILLCGRDMTVDRGIHVYDNIRRDPEAMQIILDSGVDTLLVTPADDDEQKTLKAAVRYAAGEESFMDIRNEHCLIQLGNIGTGALVMDCREKPEEVNCRIVRG